MIGVLAPQVSTVIRALLSKKVPEYELGKVYTFLGSLEALTPLATSPLLTVIFNSSLDTIPGAVYIAKAVFISAVLILFLVITLLLRKMDQSQYSELE